MLLVVLLLKSSTVQKSVNNWLPDQIQWLRLEFILMISQSPKLSIPISSLLYTKKRVEFSPFFPKLMGSGTHCSKIDGFLGTHGTHANGATD